MKLQKIILVFLSFLFVSNSFAQHIKGNGKIVTDERLKSAEFDRIDFSSLSSLVIVQSDQTKVLVESDENIQSYIVTSVKDGELNIYIKKHSSFSSTKCKVTVYVNKLTEISGNSSSSVYAESLKFPTLKIKVNSISSLDFGVDVDNLTIKANSISSFKMKGEVDNAEAKFSSISSLKMSDCKSKNLDISLNSISRASIYASETIALSAHGISSLRLGGNPKFTKKDVDDYLKIKGVTGK